MNQTKIKKYSKSDFQSTVDFMTELQKYFVEIDSLQEQTPFATRKDAEDYIHQALKDVAEMDGAIYIAEHDGKVSGFIQGVIVKHSNDIMHNLTHKKGIEGWIGLLFTDPQFRNKGIGRQLLDAIRRYFVEKGCTSIRLKVASSNQLAISIYKKYGFESRDLEMAIKI